ncbi:hypothetical protein [Brevibacillus porteri]|uniref:hypothetical protein n=1 Tax=Brevibacillus porteri TaxID=2126350 RepID=UPI00130491DE|nr:hypothetical protein [Brevibacillus porteri]MED1798852.1 hypothetical protein [Brevibacillus porteri]MED2131535.1 hypothetical protein [Brevibacillus porteri]MED2744088.1 hypothetical protein [Brevibacillus porteri]MED2813302.1 hypothetical protein [Brevibacillus porteri]MED2896620.1 hypothetical protein [Brevibacillus porteri]
MITVDKDHWLILWNGDGLEIVTEPWATNVIGLVMRIGPEYVHSGMVRDEP